MLTDGIKGLRVLIVEDESMIAMLMEDMLLDMGCVIVGVSTGVEDAIERISTVVFDAAILDLNLNGRPSYPVAQVLRDKSIPFLLSTGYGTAGVPQEFSHVPTLTKPFRQPDLEQALRVALASDGGTKAG